MTGASDILVPIGESKTLRNTVAYAVRQARESAENLSSRPTVHFVYPIRWRPIQGTEVTHETAAGLLDKVEVWAREDLETEGATSDDLPIRIRTARIGQDRYLFSPSDYASVLRDYAAHHDVSRVVVDPEYHPGGTASLIRPLEEHLERAGLNVEKAPTERVARRSPVASRSTLRKVSLVFGLSYAFYLVLGGTLNTFNLGTGALVAGLSAGVFAGITAERTPQWRPLTVRTLRLLVYFPYLLWEIAKANLSVAYIILHPKLPIDPAMCKFEAAVWGDYSVTTLANSITLTPGTLTVDVRRDSLYIHTLTQDARDGLQDGSLERAVRFVFGGRPAMRIPTPRERGSIEAPESITVRRGLRDAISELTAQNRISVPERPEGWDEE